MYLPFSINDLLGRVLSLQRNLRMMAAVNSSSDPAEIVPVSDRTNSSRRRYTCVESLHTDGVTTLSRARDETTGRTVLLKVVDPRRSGAADRDRLNREYEIAASLHLATVCRPLGIETHEGAPALVLEDWGGEPLDRAFALPMPLGLFLDCAVRIARA